MRAWVALACLGWSAAAAAAPGDDAAPAATWTGAPARLEAQRVVLAGPYTAPLLDPTGERLALSSRDGAALLVVDVAKGAPRALVHKPGAGYAAEWAPDGQAVAVRDRRAPFSGNPLQRYDLDGAFLGPHPLQQRGARAIQRDGRVVWAAPDGDRVLSPAADEPFFAPTLAPGGARVVFSGLRSGLHLVTPGTGQRYRLGPGDHPRFSGDGRWLVFDRSADDGARVIASELCLCDLRAARPRCAALTATPDRIELYPSLSHDGRRLAFIADDQVFLAELRPAASR